MRERHRGSKEETKRERERESERERQTELEQEGEREREREREKETGKKRGREIWSLSLRPKHQISDAVARYPAPELHFSSERTSARAHFEFKRSTRKPYP